MPPERSESISKLPPYGPIYEVEYGRGGGIPLRINSELRLPLVAAERGQGRPDRSGGAAPADD
jgi:hypothetical protein